MIKKLKRVLVMGLVIVMLFSVCSCANQKEATIQPMEEEEVQAVSFDFLGGQDVMPISGFYGPYPSSVSEEGLSFPSYFTDEIFSAISECGVNLIHHSYTDYNTSPELATQMLDLGEKYNIGIYVYDSAICQPTPASVASVELIDERLNLYGDHPAFCGLYGVDEPGTTYFHPTENKTRDISTYAPLFQNLRKMDVVAYGNVHPVWHEVDRENYNKMLEEYCSSCTPYYLAFDHYVWDKERTKKGWFYNLDVIRQYAEKYEIPFWTYIQAGSQWNDAAAKFDSEELFPTEGQMTWNVNISLAYGTKGIKYFPLIQPIFFAYAESTDYDFQRNGLLGAWGNKTQWWYYAKNINKQIAAVDHVLMNSVNKGVLVFGQSAIEDTEGLEFIMKETSWRELASVEGNAVVGCFNYHGKTALYVVNYEENYAQKVTLNLQDSYNVTITQNAEISRLNTKSLELDMQPGDGVLVVFD